MSSTPQVTCRRENFSGPPPPTIKWSCFLTSQLKWHGSCFFFSQGDSGGQKYSASAPGHTWGCQWLEELARVVWKKSPSSWAESSPASLHFGTSVFSELPRGLCACSQLQEKGQFKSKRWTVGGCPNLCEFGGKNEVKSLHELSWGLGRRVPSPFSHSLEPVIYASIYAGYWARKSGMRHNSCSQVKTDVYTHYSKRWEICGGSDQGNLGILKYTAGRMSELSVSEVLQDHLCLQQDKK